MSSSIDYKRLEAWCQESITILGMTGVDSKLVAMQRKIVARHAGKSALFEIADDLAEGLSFLPEDARLEASKKLVSEFGFDFNLFVDSKLKKVKAILKRGTARGEDELQLLSEFVTDTSQSEFLLMAANKILSRCGVRST